MSTCNCAEDYTQPQPDHVLKKIGRGIKKTGRGAGKGIGSVGKGIGKGLGDIGKGLGGGLGALTGIGANMFGLFLSPLTSMMGLLGIGGGGNTLLYIIVCVVLCVCSSALAAGAMYLSR